MNNSNKKDIYFNMSADDSMISMNDSSVENSYNVDSSFNNVDSSFVSFNGSNESSPEVVRSIANLLRPPSRNASEWDRFRLGSRSQEDDADVARRSQDVIINDNIHGYISVPPALQAILDTPQFDRLRSLKQLGCAHYVYPAAKHSRWEHSLGVMYLAGQFCNKIQKDHPSVSHIDKICVMMAGLCHDLGHGPFSHLWEAFVANARPGSVWRHEQSSLEMLQFLIEDNQIIPKLAQHGLTEKDIVFVKEMIHFSNKDAKYCGRGPEKHFLYEIVANKVSGVDVDKWDYFLRDDAALKVGITFDYKRFIQNAAVLDVGGKMRLCIRDKEAENLQEMFLDRARLHRKGYQHRVIKVIDLMMLDVLLAADPFIECIRDREGKTVQLSKACDDPFTHMQLSDEFIIKTIQHSFKPELQPARSILNRIIKRNFYEHVGTIDYCGKFEKTTKEMEEDLREKMTRQGEDIAVVKRTIDMGMGRSNPVERILFFTKELRTRAFNSNELRKMMPEETRNETVYVVCRSEDVDVIEAAKEAFKAWAKATFRSKGYNIKVASFSRN